MFGDLIGRRYKAVRADLSHFVTAKQLNRDGNLRYVFYTDKGNIWSPHLDSELNTVPVLMKTHITLLNVVLADREAGTLLNIPVKAFPIEVPSGKVFSWKYDHASFSEPIEGVDVPLRPTAGELEVVADGVQLQGTAAA